MSSNKLHPIYVALDSHQYSRAIKLASGLPDSNVLGKALLAHACWKGGQPKNALDTIQAILKWETTTTTTTTKDTDYIDALENEQPIVDWNVLPSKSDDDGNNKELVCPLSLADETTLETIAVTLQGMRHFGMVYRLYAWAADHHAKVRRFAMLKQYAAGLHLLVQSSKNDAVLLGPLQARALQLSRLSPTYTAWAARTALWQWQYTKDDNMDDIRVRMLPRLAESLAKKHLNASSGPKMEDSLFYVSVLQAQEKWQELLSFIESSDDCHDEDNDDNNDKDDDSNNKNNRSSSSAASTIPELQRMELQVQCYENLERWEEAQTKYNALLEKQPDQWSYWKSLVAASVQVGGLEHAKKTVLEVVKRFSSSSNNKRIRSLQLIQCELCAHEGYGLRESLETYIAAYASQTSCTFLDIKSYLQQLKKEDVEVLSSFVSDLIASNTQKEDEGDRSKLRAYICGLQIQREIDTEGLPSWIDIAKQWLSFPAAESVQKENQPSDELVLLAVDRIMEAVEQPLSHYCAAALLEMGLKKSSYNPYFKMQLMQVYAGLDSYDRPWYLFQDLGIKHIQMDSCSFLISPLLLEGGHYKRALVVANEILKFHSTTLRDSGDFIFRSLEAGTWNKASELLEFQRNRMNKSLTLLDAKNITLDCAAFYGGGKIGLHHGVVGGDDDMKRVEPMIREVNGVFGALRILKVSDESAEDYSDNRDMTILPTKLFQVATKEQIVANTMRRKFFHGVLIRAVLVLDASKGPKKGRLPKKSEELISRGNSLLKVIDNEPKTDNDDTWKDVLAQLARILVLVSCGLLVEGNDTLATREKQATELVRQTTKKLQSIKTEWTPKLVGVTFPASLLPVVSLLKMVAKVFALFGWGKRKQRDSVTALADLAGTLLGVVVNKMSCSVDTLMMMMTDDCQTQNPGLLSPSVWKEVCDHVRYGRNQTRERLKTYLEEISEELMTFETHK